MNKHLLKRKTMNLVILLLRIIAAPFNCVMIFFGLGTCTRYGISLWISIPIVVLYFGGQILLALKHIKIIHKSKLLTYILIIITGYPFGQLLSLIIKDIIKNDLSFLTDPFFYFVFPIIILPYSFVPIMLFLEHRLYLKTNIKENKQ